MTTFTTVMLNANPLLQFDGYYILSDLIEVPNLRTKADRLLVQFAAVLAAFNFTFLIVTGPKYVLGAMPAAADGSPCCNSVLNAAVTPRP